MEQQVRGTVKLHAAVTPNRGSGTFVAYLHDEGPLGLGKPAGNAPCTFHGPTPGRPCLVGPELSPPPTTFRPVAVSPW